MLVQKYLKEALSYGKKALQLEIKLPSSGKECAECYTKASSSLRCAISFEKNETLKIIYEQLNTTYEQRMSYFKLKEDDHHQMNELDAVITIDSDSDRSEESNQSLENSVTKVDSVSPLLRKKDGMDLDFRKKNTGKRSSPKRKEESDNDASDDAEDSAFIKRKKRKEFEEMKSFIIDPKRKSLENSTGWKQIVGLESVIECIREATILPQKFPQLFIGERKPWRAILLYGPPGTGKTLLASALACESEATFFSVSSADLLSKWVGQSEKKIKQLFEYASQRKPSIIFIDEIDSLCSIRNDNDSETSRRIKTEFLVQMQGVSSREGITVMGATNLPWEIDSAIRRRFEKRIYVPLPTIESRKEIIKYNIRNTPNSICEQQLDILATLTEGYSASDLSVVIRQAIMEPLRKCQHATHFKVVSATSPISGLLYNDMLEPTSEENIDPNNMKISLYDIHPEKLLPPLVSFEDFEKALSVIHPSLSKEDIEKYHSFSKIF